MSQEYTLGKSNKFKNKKDWIFDSQAMENWLLVSPNNNIGKFSYSWVIAQQAGFFFIFFYFHFFSRIIHVQYAPNNHTSVIPLWRINNSVLFLYPWACMVMPLMVMERRREKIKISNSCWKKWHGWLQEYFFSTINTNKIIDQAG